MQRIGRINMEYYREIVLSGLGKLLVFSVIVIVISAKEVANSRENDVILVSGRGCLLKPSKFPNRYEKLVIGIGWVPRKCAPGLQFKYQECRCSPKTRKDSPEPQKQSSSLRKNIFKSNGELHSTHSTPSSLLKNIINNDKSKNLVNYGSRSRSSDPEKLTESLTSSTTRTAASVANTIPKDEHVNEATDLSLVHSRQEVSKHLKTDKPLDRIQAKDFESNNILTGNMKLSLSDLTNFVSSMDKKSITDSKEKPIKTPTHPTLFTTIKPPRSTTSQTPEQSSPYKKTGYTKGKMASTTSVMLDALKKERKDSARRKTTATTQQHPKIVLDYSSVTISEPFGVFDLSKDIPSYLPAERWLKSRLPVIETERRRGRNMTSNLWLSNDDLHWSQNLLRRQFIASINRKTKLRVRAAETDPNNKTTEQRELVL